MNKTVFITGASSGIGEGCARKFAAQGARLILNSRSKGKLETLAKELN
jgi:short-subunit dehydrogenase